MKYFSQIANITLER